MLLQIFARLKSKGLTVGDVIAVFRTRPFFSAEALPLIEDGLTKWFADDQVGAIHVLVPQIEAVVRAMLRAVGVPVTRVEGTHVQMLLLTQLLNRLERFGFPDDIMFTMEAILTDAGLNVRNRVAHGWLKRQECTPALTVRIVHLLLALATLQGQETKA